MAKAAERRPDLRLAGGRGFDPSGENGQARDHRWHALITRHADLQGPAKAGLCIHGAGIG
jgi:hypothetical protein